MLTDMRSCQKTIFSGRFRPQSKTRLGRIPAIDRPKCWQQARRALGVGLVVAGVLALRGD
ncbi:hypothetical protein ASF43_13720 [Pseudorhodoferax sp. Leaf267]|nr:hypothetical protein ASF43_13720 [Pseudorhodoferax sp. Leaf267]